MLKAYPNAQVFSGHSHRNSNMPVGHPSNGSGINEMVFVGNWGHTSNRCMGDGTPFGFGVYDFSGAGIQDNYFRSCTSREYDQNYQMRAYLSDMLSGKDATTSTAKTGWYGSYYATSTSTSKYMYVNIFNGNADWTVNLKIRRSSGSTRTYPMERLSGAENGTWGSNGEGTTTIPYRPTGGTDTRDWWVAGGFANSKASGMLTKTSCYHMFRTTSYISSSDVTGLKNGTYTFVVEATDPYGTTHKCSKLFDANDIADYLIYEWQQGSLITYN